ncbi:hypothetical protein LG326_03675 [Metaplanococcus flavidus]
MTKPPTGVNPFGGFDLALFLKNLFRLPVNSGRHKEEQVTWHGNDPPKG